MNRLLHLDEPFPATAAVPPQCFANQRQPHPLVRLAAGHGALSQQDEMAAPARWVVEKPHQLDTVPRRAVTHGLGGDQILASCAVATHRMAIVEIELAERREVLLPLVDEVRRDHDDDGPSRASCGDAVRDGERDECLSHADFVGKNHTGLSAKSRQNGLDLLALALLVRCRDAILHPGPEHQLGWDAMQIAPYRHRSTTRRQKPMSSGDTFDCRVAICS